jgi:hypothetical protein
MSDTLIPGSETSTETSTAADAGEQTTTTEPGSEASTETTSNEEGGFLFADGVVGEGEAPEWFKSKKYKTVADQAQAYTELESKFGAFTGAPKDGVYEIEGINFEENPLMGTVAEWGKEMQLSPEGLESLVVKVGELAQRQQDEDKAAALEALGEQGESRLRALGEWGKNNLAPEEFTQFQGLAQTAGHVEILEKLIGMTKNSKLVDKSQVASPKSADTEAALKAQYTATNDKGQRLMDVDPAYKAKVNKAMKDFYGS